MDATIAIRRFEFRGILGLLGWLGLSFLAGGVGGFFMPGEWYEDLQKPSWNPPGWLFGPVWSVLYAMMAVSAWSIWRRGGFRAQRSPLSLFLVQLLLNALWSPLFFGLKWPGLAFLEIVVLWFAIVLTILAFNRVCRASALMLIPYLLWVSFASVLNFTLWRMNS